MTQINNELQALANSVRLRLKEFPSGISAHPNVVQIIDPDGFTVQEFCTCDTELVQREVRSFLRAVNIGMILERGKKDK